MISCRVLQLASVLSVFIYGARDVAAQSFTIAQNYAGNTFFDGWDFYAGVDSNFGNVLYVDEQTAMSQQLAYINPAGNVVLKVDNVTNGAGDSSFGRNSINITTTGTFYIGSLVVMDAVHMPFGCSVWPAFWSKGPNWPDGGEIDIVEQVNLATNNQHALHTTDGCTHPDAASSTGLETGNLISTDCFNATNGDEGCLIQDPSTNSYGAPFASNGGGVFATLWTDDGISIWFFERGSIPADVPTDSPNPSGWGTPTAFYPSSTCDMQTFFAPQNLIIDIDICGSFAIGAFNDTCSGNCEDLVADPSNYDDAYFELSYVRIFTNGTVNGTTTQNSSSSSTSGSNPTTSGSSGSSGSGGSSSSDTNGAFPSVQTFMTIMTAVLLPAAVAIVTVL